MKRRAAIVLASILALGWGPYAHAQKKFEGVTLKMLGIGDTSVTRIATVVSEFEQETGAKVQIDMLPYPGLIDKIVVETSNNRPTYQLLWVDSPWVGQLGEAGALMDLTDLAKRDAKEMGLADIIPIQLQENAWKGRLLAFPASGMIWQTNYRKDLVENAEEKAAFKVKYGYELGVPKTWAQYRDVAEFFTRKKGDKLAGKVLEKDFYGTAAAYSRVQGAITHTYFPIMRSFGGDYWDTKTGLCALNQEPQIKAAEFMKSLIPFNPPDYLGLMWDLESGYMERGETAISSYWSVRTVRLENPKEAKIGGTGAAGYAGSPTVDGKPHPTMTGALSYGINSRVSAKEKEAAWAFIKWSTSEKMMRRLANEGWGISQFRKSLLSDPALQKKYPYYKVILDTQVNARRRIFHPFYADVEEAFGLELNKYMAGETKTAAEALNKGCQTINSRLSMFPVAQRLKWIEDTPLKF